MTSTVDNIRAIFTYVIATIVVAGGGVMLFLLPETATDTKVVIGGFMGVALNFVFAQEVATRTARQSSAATLAAVMSTNGGTVGAHP